MVRTGWGSGVGDRVSRVVAVNGIRVWEFFLLKIFQKNFSHLIEYLLKLFHKSFFHLSKILWETEKLARRQSGKQYIQGSRHV